MEGIQGKETLKAADVEERQWEKDKSCYSHSGKLKKKVGPRMDH